MPSSTELQHRRTHNLLLATKLLNGRDSASPFTLIIDTIEQSGRIVVDDIVRRAKAGRNKVVYISCETHRKPPNVDAVVPAFRLSSVEFQKQAIAHLASGDQKVLFVVDSVNALASNSAVLPSLLSSFITPKSTLVAMYHADIPPELAPSPYLPDTLTVLNYLATTILTIHSFSHLLAERAARDRSLASPLFGLQSDLEGVISSLGCNDTRGCAIEMEYRRKSGRGVREWYYLSATAPAQVPGVKSQFSKERIILLEDHPLLKRPEDSFEQDNGTADTTFDLGLTEKQRRDREAVVLPYFDAQRSEGVGQGGRILYDMGSEDDFDEEEDEI